MLELFTARFPTAGADFTPGVDVSGYQNASIWDGLDWVGWACAKASEGTHYTEPNLIQHVSKAAERNKHWGPYHFARFGDLYTEASRYLRSIDTVVAGFGAPHFHMLDLEAPLTGDATLWAERWCQVIQSYVPAPVFIYTSQSWANSHLTTPNYGLQNRPLWVANYASPGAPGPAMPALWSDWTIWQWAETSQLGSLDLNVAKPAFTHLLTPPVTIEDDMAFMIRTPDTTIWTCDGVWATPLTGPAFNAAVGKGMVPAQYKELTWDEAGQFLRVYEGQVMTIAQARAKAAG